MLYSLSAFVIKQTALQLSPIQSNLCIYLAKPKQTKKFSSVQKHLRILLAQSIVNRLNGLSFRLHCFTTNNQTRHVHVLVHNRLFLFALSYFTKILFTAFVVVITWKQNQTREQVLPTVWSSRSKKKAQRLQWEQTGSSRGCISEAAKGNISPN